jgi:hypothetical protein
MTINEIKNDCIFIEGVTNSNRIRAAMALTLSYLTPDVPGRTMRWIVPMLYDMAAYANLYGDPDVAGRIDDAAKGLWKHLDSCTNRPG